MENRVGGGERKQGEVARKVGGEGGSERRWRGKEETPIY